MLSGSEPVGGGGGAAPGLEAQSGGSRDSGRGGAGLPPPAPPPRASPKHQAALQQQQQQQAEQQASRMSIDEQGAQAFNRVGYKALITIPLHHLSGLRLQGCAAGFKGEQSSPDLTAEHTGQE